VELKDFILKSLENMQKALTAATSDLEYDEIKWQAGPRANPIGFILWHQLRVEDRFVHTLFQQKTQLYEQDKWYQKMGLPNEPDNTGRGYNAEQIAAFPVPELKTLQQYGDAVRRHTIEYINSTGPEELNRILDRPGVGKIPISEFFLILLGEVHQHIGQIAYLRGLVRSRKQ